MLACLGGLAAEVCGSPFFDIDGAGCIHINNN